METPNRVLTKRRLCLSQICKRRILDVFTSYFANKQPHCIFPQLHPNKSVLWRAGVQLHSLGLSRAARWPLRRATGRRGLILPARYPHQTQSDPLLPHASVSSTPDSFRGVSRVQSPRLPPEDPQTRNSTAAWRGRRRLHTGQAPDGGESPSPPLASPLDPLRPEPRSPIPLPPFPHGTQPPRPPCSKPAGKACQVARYLPGAVRAASPRRRRCRCRRPQRDAPAAAARAPSGASMTAGPRRQSRPCAGGGAAPPWPIRATSPAPGGGTTPPLEGAVRAQPAARGRWEELRGAGVCGGREGPAGSHRGTSGMHFRDTPWALYEHICAVYQHCWVPSCAPQRKEDQELRERVGRDHTDALGSGASPVRGGTAGTGLV